MTYESARTKLVGLAFVLGPALLTAAATTFALDLGRNPNDLDSYVEGIIGFYGMILFVPIFVTLGALIGRYHVKTGLVLSTLGLFSAAGGVLPMSTRVLQGGLTDAGVAYDLWDLFESPPVAFIVIVPPLFALVGAAIGVMLYRIGAVERHVGILMVVAMPFFYVAQAGGVAVEFTWTLTNAIYLVALAPLGIRMLRTGSLERVQSPAI